MSEVDDRLLHAKKLLKKYQSKYQQPDSRTDNLNGFQHSSDLRTFGDDHEGLCSGSNEPDGTSNAPSRNSSCPSSACNEKSQSKERPFSVGLQTPNNSEPSPSSDNTEIAFLRRTLYEKEQSLSDTANKLQLLHTHYSELYEAYNLVNQQVQRKSGGGDQISQLQTALAVAIEEKTGLQSQLREFNSRISGVEAENRSLKESQKISKASWSNNIDQTETIKQFGVEKQRLVEIVTNQSLQIEKQRKECSNLEAKIVVIQQDRNETQARLKHLYEEKTALENDIEQMKNDLNMKEIYIRQLTRHSQADPQEQVVIRSLTEEKKRCEEEVATKHAEISELKKHSSAEREHFESCMSDMNEKLCVFQFEVTKLKASKSELESAKSYLEEQLRLVRVNLESERKDIMLTSNGHQEHADSKVDLSEYEALKNSLSSLDTEYARNCSKLREMDMRLEQRNSQLEAIQFELVESHRRVKVLEEARDAKSSMYVDTVALSEQLQNEKATVSRAVGQNLELKEQLRELQDKLIFVTNESATKEIERTSALANLGILQQKLSEAAVEKKNHATAAVVDQVQLSQVSQSEEKGCQTESTLGDVREVVEKKDFALVEPEHEAHKPKLEGKQSIRPSKSAESKDIELDQETVAQLPRSHSPAPINGQRQSNSSTPNSMLNESSLKELEQRLEKALSENSQFRMSNERLQHWLTALETENESIGEYVALYRFQRQNIQKKVAESEMALHRTRSDYSALMRQLTDLQSAVISFIKQKEEPIPPPQKQKQKQQKFKENQLESRELDEAVESSVSQMIPLNNSPESNSVPKTNGPDGTEEKEESGSSDFPTPSSDERGSEALERIIQIINQQQLVLQREHQCMGPSSGGASLSDPTTITCSGCVECRGEMFTL